MPRIPAPRSRDRPWRRQARRDERVRLGDDGVVDRISQCRFAEYGHWMDICIPASVGVGENSVRPEGSAGKHRGAAADLGVIDLAGDQRAAGAVPIDSGSVGDVVCRSSATAAAASAVLK